MVGPGLGISPGRDLVEYLVTQRPPSGSHLLVAPMGSQGWRLGRYWATTGRSLESTSQPNSKSSQAWQCLLQCDTAAHSGFGPAASQRWLCRYISIYRLIADAGGWALKYAAVHLYLSSTPHDILHMAFCRPSCGCASRTTLPHSIEAPPSPSVSSMEGRKEGRMPCPLQPEMAY